MKANEQERVAFLDGVRLKRGEDALIESFRNTLQADRQRALEYLNDDHLCFPSFYMLFNEIAINDLRDQLSERHCIAEDFLQDSESMSYYDFQKVYAVLKWVVETGGGYSLDNGYLQKIDTAAAMLTVVYGDQAILPSIVDSLFTRYRKGLPYHYLSWAFFEARNPNSLTMIADHLRSSDKSKIECGCRLLSFISGIEKVEGEERYQRFCKWLEENEPFLWYKGETFDTTHQPEPYVIILGAKYLGHFVDLERGTPYTSLTKKENQRLRQFADLSDDQQRELASQSARKRKQDREEWHEWLSLPIKKQLKAGEGGDSRD